MKKLILSAFSLFLSTTALSNTNLKLEGVCQGTLADNTPVEVKYYSDFDGCKDESSAAISYVNPEGEVENISIGKREFVADKDRYTFEGNRLEFENSTGNTSGTLKQEGSEAVLLQCEVRDYHFEVEC